ncbi:response regulator [Paragemmobacter straminiformis]|uniref:Response regulator n=1 Tax=Paragemmobacter straminiformis TaxID=2045119 RepID=A0A842I4Q3_9RHOB|nr:response regulator [Gemmobacter straminiformis]MBC2834551.1 response regulator [Gemmobacter straminiformis]
MTIEAKVLVVDDSRTSRMIVNKALQQLGCQTVEAASGREALDLMGRDSFDLVLLDIEMPEMDGLAVLRQMRATGDRLNTPVLVISGQEGNLDVVVAAIELGAEDFLPKPFDPTLFRARVASCVEKKRLRDTEIDYLRQMDKLSEAAMVMESGKFHPANLGLEAVAARPDSAGRLAAVFVEMATQVYDRELALQRNVRTLKGGAVLLLSGLLWGLVVPLSVMIYRENPLTLGVTFWSNLVAGLVCCGWAVATGKSLRITWSEFLFLLVWALIFGFSSVVLFEAAGRVSGIALSIIMAMQGFAVFAIAAVMRIEAPSLRRFIGLALGLVGVLALLLVREDGGALDGWGWMLIAMMVPILYGAIDILLAVKHPPTLDSVVSSGLVLVLSAVLVLPFALWRGHFFVLAAEPGLSDLLVAITGFCIGLCTVLYIRLIAMAGAVFGSQSAYAVTVAGIGWSVLLLGESLSLWTGFALVMIVSGLLLVGPKREAGNVEVEFRRKRKARLGKAITA